MSHLRRFGPYAALFLLVVGYYYWQCGRKDDSCQVWNIFADTPYRTGGYGELTDAFLHHSLSLLTPVDPKFALAKNPYDPSARPPDLNFPWDDSYYKGKLYLYFGPVPALLIGCPWHFFFGYLPTQNAILFLLSVANLALFVVLLRFLVNHYFSRVPVSFEYLLFLVYAFAGLLPFILSRPDKYDIAVGSAALFTLAFFLALLFGLRHETKRWLAFALASCSAGLAAGSRPTTVFLLVLLAACWLFLNWRKPFGSAALREMAAIGFPAVFAVTALLWYNVARFGDPFQFGNRYLMNYGDVYFHPNFQFRNILDGMWSYYLQPWHTTVEFPCIGLGSDLHPPAAIFIPDRGREISSGLLPAAPIVLLGATWWWYARKLAPVERTQMQLFGGLLSAWSVFFGVLISAFFFVTTRYEVELQLPLLLLASFALLARRNLGPLAAWEGVCLLLLVQVSCYVGIAFGLIGENDWMHHYLHPGS